jgi:hypothetical protein
MANKKYGNNSITTALQRNSTAFVEDAFVYQNGTDIARFEETPS